MFSGAVAAIVVIIAILTMVAAVLLIRTTRTHPDVTEQDVPRHPDPQ